MTDGAWRGGINLDARRYRDVLSKIQVPTLLAYGMSLVSRVPWWSHTNTV
jgi:hypothetical protein